MRRWLAGLAVVLSITVAHAQQGLPGGGGNGIPSGGGGGGGGGTGTVTSIATGCQATGGTITTSGTISTKFTLSASSPVSSSSYAVVAADACNLLLLASGNTALTIAAATTSGFGNGTYWAVNNQSGGSVTLTPTTSTIDGGSSVTIANNTTYGFQSDGTNYHSTQIAGSGGSGNTTISPATGNTANDIVTMSNTTTTVKDSGTALSSLAPLASPTFTGTPAAPTPGSNVNTTQIPTSAWVNTYFGALAGANAWTGANSYSVAGQAFNAVGSAAAPTIVGGGCGTGCGFYWPTTAEFGLAIGGVVKLDYGATNASSFTFAPTHTYFTTIDLTNNVDLNGTSPTIGALDNGVSLAITTASQVGPATGGSLNMTAASNSQASGTHGAGGINLTAGSASGAGSSGNGGNIVLTAGTTVGGTAGTIQMVNLGGAATGTAYLCWNSSGNTVSEDTTCTTSAKYTKDMRGNVNGPDALAALVSLPAGVPIWDYKDTPKIIHAGIYADDVAVAMPRCAVYEKGRIRSYDDRCVIGYLAAAVKEQQIEIEALKSHIAVVDHASLR